MNDNNVNMNDNNIKRPITLTTTSYLNSKEKKE